MLRQSGWVANVQPASPTSPLAAAPSIAPESARASCATDSDETIESYEAPRLHPCRATVPSNVHTPATTCTPAGGRVVVVKGDETVVDVGPDPSPGNVVVLVPSSDPLLGKASAQIATPWRRQSRRMGMRHFRNALPFGGQTPETIGAQALRQTRNAVRASAIEPRSRTARSRETLRSMDILMPWRTAAPSALCRRRRGALAGCLRSPPGPQRSKLGSPDPGAPTSAAVSAPRAAPGA